MKIKTFFRFAKVRYLWRNIRGFCPVCGRYSLFLLTDNITSVRNDGLCVRCGSCCRHRHVALSILETFKEKGVSKLSEFSARNDLSVFNTSSGSPITRRMGASSTITVSEFFDDCKPGEYKNGILCQDLERLTFQDNAFDLVISEDVFEHVRDWRKGFSEVHRILKKSGYHIFSIPFYFDRRTEELFTLNNGVYTLREPIEYHGDPVRGAIPAYSHLGYDLFDLLRGIGFDAKLNLSHHSDAIKFATFDSYTFVTKKVRL